MTYGDCKDLLRRTAAEKVLVDKAFNIAKNPKYDGYQRGLASLVYNKFDKKSYGSGVESEIMPNKELVEKLLKPIIRLFEKQNIFVFHRQHLVRSSDCNWTRTHNHLICSKRTLNHLAKVAK